MDPQEHHGLTESPVAEGALGVGCIMLGFASHMWMTFPWGAVPIVVGTLIGLSTLWRITVRCCRKWHRYGWRAIIMADIE